MIAELLADAGPPAELVYGGLVVLIALAVGAIVLVIWLIKRRKR